MQTRSKFIHFLTIFLALAFSVTMLSAQDFEGMLKYETVKNDKNEESQVLYLASDKMRIDDLENKRTVIIDLEKEAMLNVNHKNQTYNEVGFEQMRAGMEKAQNAMDEAMKKMTPEQREMMKKMGVKIPGMAEEKKEKMFEVKETGESATINGYSCQKYLLTKNIMNKSETDEIWITTELGSADNMSRIMSKMVESMGMEKFLGSMAAYKELKGIPVKVVEGKDTRLLVEATKGGISDDDFQAPADYEKKEISGMPH